MFDVWKRGVDPFAELREMSSHMRDTPASALIRANAINSMSTQPKDVVREWVRRAYIAGVDVFTNFCAHNDWRNHIAVAEAVHEVGGHYQACLSWAVLHSDPTIYNVRWAVEFFRPLVEQLGAHSLYVKDPSGVLTPDMAGQLAAALKDAYPHLPLVFHTHYQTGYGYMSYSKAVENGANGIECSLGFADGAGQPYSLTMLRALEDLGIDVGTPNRDAMHEVVKYCKTIAPYYKQDDIRRPDISVEVNGIAGGQRSILDKELTECDQPHLIAEVDTEVAITRREGGTVCQVTPVADSYAREAMRRLRGQPKDRDFAPGYRAILTGEGGLVKEPCDPTQQAQAIWERATATVKAMVSSGVLTNQCEAELNAGAASDEDASGSWLRELVAVLEEAAGPIRRNTRAEEVRHRIAQLEGIIADASTGTKPAAVVTLKSLQRRIARAADVDASGKVINTVEDRISVLRSELESLETEAKNAAPPSLSQQEYEALLLRTAEPSVYSKLVASVDTRVTAANTGGKVSTAIESPALALSSGSYTDAFRSLVSGSGFVSVCFADTLAPALDDARAALRKLAEEHKEIGDKLDFDAEPGTPEARRVKDWTVLQAAYGVAAIPNLIRDFFINVDSNPSAWEPTYDVKAEENDNAEEQPQEEVQEEDDGFVVHYGNFVARAIIREINGYPPLYV